MRLHYIRLNVDSDFSQIIGSHQMMKWSFCIKTAGKINTLKTSVTVLAPTDRL